MAGVRRRLGGRSLSQPWLFGVTPSFIEVQADRSKSLGAMDPLSREMFIAPSVTLKSTSCDSGTGAPVELPTSTSGSRADGW